MVYGAAAAAARISEARSVLLYIEQRTSIRDVDMISGGLVQWRRDVKEANNLQSLVACFDDFLKATEGAEYDASMARARVAASRACTCACSSGHMTIDGLILHLKASRTPRDVDRYRDIRER